MKLSINLIAILCLLYACKEHEKDSRIVYNLSNAFSIKIPSDASPIFRSAQYLKNDKEKLLYILSSEANIIHIYDLYSLKLKDSIYLDKNGIDGVGKIHSIYVVNKDSIFVTPSYNYKYYLINSKGKVLKTYSLLNEMFGEKTYSSLPRGGFEAPTIKIKNFLYISGIPDIDPFKDDFCKKAKPLMKYNLQSAKNEYLIGYPEIYCNKMLPLQYIGVVFRDFNIDTKRFIYSFPADENLLEVDLAGNIMAKHPTKSKFFSEIQPMKRRSSDPRFDYDHYIGNDSYERICYDTYRKLYYRFVLHPDVNQKSDNSKMFFPVKYSVVVLDKDFVKIGEIQLPTEYKYGFFYCDEEGLYLQKVPTNEDRYEFGLLTVRKL